MTHDRESFDRDHASALRGIWFLGDVHGQFKHIAQALIDAPQKPNWLVFLGDVELEFKSLREMLAPLHRKLPGIQVAFIHGNHDADTHEHWAMLHDCGGALALHGQVLNLDGVRVAGLGGNFLGRIWSPPGPVLFRNKREAVAQTPRRSGQQHNPKLYAAIYPDDVERLAKQRADILITHEAPSCHPHGFAALDELARSMRVVRSFHGHHHDDLSEEYAKVRDTLGFDARGVDFCGIKNGLGEVILRGEAGW
jgi:Icc-related predicted phosphoesterase